jgi:hypothetical protein
MFPVLQRLELKEGAQIMFIRNDSEDQMYFNGKLATVKSIDGDSVEVMLADSHVHIELRREKWENKKYTINKDNNDIDDEVVGSFSQYPVRLAWAITVHKSQGLTFEKAIIDVGQAFTGGQVYVALSRLTSLEGLVLRSRIDPKVISADHQVVSFSRSSNKPGELPAIMKQKQSEFISQLIDQTFDFSVLSKEISYVNRNKKESVSLKETSMKPLLEQMALALDSERDNTIAFRKQLHFLVRSNDHEKLLERIRKGSEYYRKFLIGHLKVLLTHTREMKQHKRVKTYLTSLSELDQLFSKTLLGVDKSLSLIEGILKSESTFDFTSLIRRIAEDRAQLVAEIEKEFPNSKKASSGTGKKGGRKKGGPSTYDITLKMWAEGMNIESIARERELVPGTIEGHLAKAVQSGKLDIDQFVAQNEIELINKAITEMPSGFSSKDLFIKLDGQYSYAKLRAVMSHKPS